MTLRQLHCFHYQLKSHEEVGFNENMYKRNGLSLINGWDYTKINKVDACYEFEFYVA